MDEMRVDLKALFTNRKYQSQLAFWKFKEIHFTKKLSLLWF